ncbi:MAG: hypothetical protein RLY86_4119 [Pseudomonadota bacterium]|jgi:NADPH-dependent 2,4-dienoyl-CoA reductase/sulfur reductase-like enzyme
MTRSTGNGFTLSRRSALLGAGGLAAAGIFAPYVARGAAPKVVIVGGGFGGAAAARHLRKTDPGIEVTLIERSSQYLTCPFSNLVLAGLRSMDQITHSYDRLPGRGIKLVTGEVTGIDADKRQLRLKDGGNVPYDRVILSPGVDLRFDGLPGYTAEAAEVMPHAWKAGPQTVLLKKQLEAMPDGGTVIIVAPDNPFRCPPGPYERASMIAHYLKTAKPKSKVLILDAKEKFSKQGLFQAAWASEYPDMVQWIGKAEGGKVTAVDPGTLSVTTDFGSEKGAVVNVIPPQKAGALAGIAGVADASGWCPVDFRSFESTLVPNVHVIGDACIAPPMPKSATAATAQARVAALAVVDLLRGQQPVAPSLSNTCYSLIGPEYGISVTGVYVQEGAALKEVAGGVSPGNASAEDKALEAQYAYAWYAGVTAESFGA